MVLNNGDVWSPTLKTIRKKLNLIKFKIESTMFKNQNFKVTLLTTYHLVQICSNTDSAKPLDVRIRNEQRADSIWLHVKIKL